MGRHSLQLRLHHLHSTTKNAWMSYTWCVHTSPPANGRGRGRGDDEEDLMRLHVSYHISMTVQRSDCAWGTHWEGRSFIMFACALLIQMKLGRELRGLHRAPHFCQGSAFCNRRTSSAIIEYTNNQHVSCCAPYAAAVKTNLCRRLLPASAALAVLHVSP
jgi:hypothetical protein